MYVDEIKYFLDCISTNKNTNNDIKNGISTLKIALDIIESSKSKRLIAVFTTRYEEEFKLKALLLNNRLNINKIFLKKFDI